MTTIDRETRDQWREQHGYVGLDGHVGYLCDDLSYPEWCCYECGQAVPCATIDLLDALDAAEAKLAKFRELVSGHWGSEIRRVASFGREVSDCVCFGCNAMRILDGRADS